MNKMTEFATAAEYALKYEEYCKEMKDTLNTHESNDRTEQEQLQYIAHLQERIRFYAPHVSISLYDLIEHLPVLAQHGFSIVGISFHHRKAWGEEEYIVFRHRGEDKKNDVWMRAPNTRKDLTRTFISIAREEAILIGFEAETSREHMSDINDTRRAFEIVPMPINYK